MLYTYSFGNRLLPEDVFVKKKKKLELNLGFPPSVLHMSI